MSTDHPPKSPMRDWAAIARDYSAGALTVSEICALHNVSQSALYQRAHRYRWKKRSDRAPRAAAPCVKRSPDLTQRLLTALDQKMTEFENRMAEGGVTSAADSERDARTLNTLVRLFDKLKGFGNATGAKKAAASVASATVPSAQPSVSGNDAHDADRLRHDLAQRLEKLGHELNSR